MRTPPLFLPLDKGEIEEGVERFVYQYKFVIRKEWRFKLLK